MKQPYRVIEPIKYGHDHYSVDAKVMMEPELGSKLCTQGLLETWPENEAERAARLKAEIDMQADLQRAEREKAERELAETQRERDSSDQETSQQKAGSDDASQSEPRDSQDAQSGSKDGTAAGAEDASAAKSTGGTKKNPGKK